MKEDVCVCGTKAEKIKTLLELFDGDVMIKDVDALYCPKCDMELSAEAGDSLVIPSTTFTCERCGYQQAYEASRTKIQTLVVQEIERRARTGEWKQAVHGP